MLRIKLAGAPDSELATVLSVSRPTAAKRKSETFDRLRAAWVRAGAPDGSESIRLAAALLAVATDFRDTDFQEDEPTRYSPATSASSVR